MNRYYLTIKTEPHRQKMVPSGWEADTLADAVAMARRADRLWSHVRLYDSHRDGTDIPWRDAHRLNSEGGPLSIGQAPLMIQGH